MKIKNTSTLLIISISIILLCFSVKGVAMSFLFGTEVVLFSPMEGKLTFEGKPAANAKIVRTIIWKGDEGETDTFYTSEDGSFTLPLKRTKIRIPPLTEFRVIQEISVFYENQEFMIWVKGKSDTTEFGELGGIPQNLRCELTDESVRIDDFGDLFGTSCKWNSIEKQGEK